MTRKMPGSQEGPANAPKPPRVSAPPRPPEAERPEERDSLGLIEQRMPFRTRSELMADLRTLINEVKYEREEYHLLMMSRDAMQSERDALEAEVKELREENASQQAELRDLYRIREDPRIKQMEEALREARDHLRFNAWKDDPNSDKRFVAVQKLDAALSPSDTEEASQ